MVQAIAEVIPYFPFKKLEKFYDVQGLLNHPKLLNAMCAVMARRFRKMKVTKICGFEAESQGQQTNFAATVVECACMVELQALNGREKCLKAGAESAVEQKQVAQQQAERARYLVLKAQEEKKRTIIYAEGEKESARMIGDAIKANPGFVELRKISVAKDISNLLAKSANRMVLNTEGLLMNLGIENEGMPKKK
eukprot:symbB.v1.2.023540.t1/scaffold2159.1/size105835/8